ncbi:MAG: hypothetical protein HY925_16205 [Elusimicrobia bacterium]|nr:hypothetical protein [Elusimicrobiota bacterium]
MDPGAYPGAWGVLGLFCIPIGGGIPAGVLLAKARGIPWPVMEVLYFVSDVLLACTFEPVLRFLILLGRRSPAVKKVADAIRLVVRQSAARYGSAAGPLALIGIAFGVDPMTGRAAAHAAGHGFVAGWAIAIAGDMIYFTVIMISTLWLGSMIGDGTVVTFIILALMFAVPAAIRKLKASRA